MLLRAKSSPALSLILAATLAWPANIPLSTPPELPRVAAARPSADLRAGISVGRIDRDSHARSAELALGAGDLEESDGWDGPALLPTAPGSWTSDLPSLVPSPLRGRPSRLAGVRARSARSPLLRC